MKKERNVAIVLAAGRGSRMGSAVHKQYLLLCDKPVLYYSLRQFEEFAEVTEVILVTGESEIEYCRREIVQEYGLKKVTKIVAGGTERYHSVYQGLRAAGDCDHVLIHDGARPFLSQCVLQRAMDEVRLSRACAVGMPVKDTIKEVDEQQFAINTPDRSRIWQVQTPQVFDATLIREAYEELMKRTEPSVTDDAMVLEQMKGYPVRLVEGSYRNIKITTPEDLVIAEAFLAHPSE